jgi:hypothetical protein
MFVLFWETLFGCSHAWGWPQALEKEEPGYDSYQACTECGRTRFYDSATMTGGPTFTEIR